MNVQYLGGIITVACVVALVALICDEWSNFKKSLKTKSNIYQDIQPHQVAMMKKIFPNFDWVRIDREIVEAQKDTVVVYEADYIDETGTVQCSQKRLDTKV